MVIKNPVLFNKCTHAYTHSMWLHKSVIKKRSNFLYSFQITIILYQIRVRCTIKQTKTTLVRHWCYSLFFASFSLSLSVARFNMHVSKKQKWMDFYFADSYHTWTQSAHMTTTFAVYYNRGIGQFQYHCTNVVSLKSRSCMHCILITSNNKCTYYTTDTDSIIR